jgi:dihydroneopterin aldolase
MITTLAIENIECYAYHGCLPEENIIGGRFSVDVILEADFIKAVDTDDLTYAADYVMIDHIVRKEMSVPSKLIEHVAGRILKKLSAAFQLSENITVTVKKYNPPVTGGIGAAVFRISLH